MPGDRPTSFGMSVGRMLAQRRILRDVLGVNSAWFLVVGLECELFPILASGAAPQDLTELRDPQLVTAWLETGVSLGFLRHSAGRYHLRRRYQPLVVPGSPANMAGLLRQATRLQGSTFSALPEVLRTGERAAVLQENGGLVASVSRNLEPLALRLLLERSEVQRARRVLDVGCGEGGYLVGHWSASPRRCP